MMKKKDKNAQLTPKKREVQTREEGKRPKSQRSEKY